MDNIKNVDIMSLFRDEKYETLPYTAHFSGIGER